MMFLAPSYIFILLSLVVTNIDSVIDKEGSIVSTLDNDDINTNNNEIYSDISKVFNYDFTIKHSSQKTFIDYYKKYELQEENQELKETYTKTTAIKNNVIVSGDLRSYILSLPSCDISCHQLFSNHFGIDNYVIVSPTFSLLYSTKSKIRKFETKNANIIQFKTVLLPELKVDRNIYYNISNPRFQAVDSEIGCYNNTSQIKLILFPFSSIRNQNAFLQYADSIASMSSINSSSYSFEYDEKQTLNRISYASVSINNCTLLEDLTQILSARREVIRIEKKYDIFTHNRWVRGICETNNYAQDSLKSINITGEQQIIGIADTGIDMKSCFFEDPNCSIPYSKDGSVINNNCRKVVQYVTYTDGTDEAGGHGTHVAGIAAGLSIFNYGDYKKFQGSASGAKIAFFDLANSTTFSKTGALHVPNNYNNDMFKVLYRGGARVLSNSWGSKSNNYDSGAMQSDQFMWENTDALLVFSAGNDGCLTGCSSTIGSPAVSKNSITVGASLNDHQSWQNYISPDIGSQFNQDSLAAFSSSGLTSDGRLKPDVTAPGSYITSANAKVGAGQHCTIKAMEGTSQAVPVVAGHATKIRQYFMEGYYPGGERNMKNSFIPSGALLKAVLTHSGQALQFVVDTIHREQTPVTLSSYPSKRQGYGRIQLDSVLHFGKSSLSPLSLFVVGAKNSTQLNYAALITKTQVDQYSFTVSTNPINKVRLTLAYTDYPGLPGTSNSMMNTLNVYIENIQTLKKYTPLTVSETIISNLQVIDIPLSELTPSAQFKVRVSANNNKLVIAQPYALVLTGDVIYLNNSPKDDDNTNSDYTQLQFSKFSIIFISIVSAIIVLLAILLFYFRRLTSNSILIDPKNFDNTGYGSPISFLMSERSPNKKGLLSRMR